MLCSLYKWYVSRSLDLGKSIPAFFSRHGLRCRACREYTDFCATLEPKAACDFKKLLQEPSPALPQISTLQANKKPVRNGNKFFRFPALSAAAVILVIFVCLVWLTFFPVEEKEFPGINLSSLSLEKAAMNIEDPYEKEYLELKRTMKTTANYLAACLDVRIGDSIE